MSGSGDAKHSLSAAQAKVQAQAGLSSKITRVSEVTAQIEPELPFVTSCHFAELRQRSVGEL
jgi:hypothetical protein